MERRSDLHRFLARHGVHHEKNFRGRELALHCRKLLHELLVGVKPPGRVKKDYVKQPFRGELDRSTDDGKNVRFPCRRTEKTDLRLFGKNPELFHCGRPLEVTGHHEGVVAGRKFLRYFHCGGGFSAALEPYHEIHGGRHGRDGQGRGFGSHERRKLLVDYGSDLLARSNGFEDILADRPGFDGFDEGFHNLVIHVGFKEPPPDLPEGTVNIGFGKLARLFSLAKTLSRRSRSASNIVVFLRSWIHSCASPSFFEGHAERADLFFKPFFPAVKTEERFELFKPFPAPGNEVMNGLSAGPEFFRGFGKGKIGELVKLPGLSLFFRQQGTVQIVQLVDEKPSRQNQFFLCQHSTSPEQRHYRRLPFACQEKLLYTSFSHPGGWTKGTFLDIIGGIQHKALKEEES